MREDGAANEDVEYSAARPALEHAVHDHAHHNQCQTHSAHRAGHGVAQEKHAPGQTEKDLAALGGLHQGQPVGVPRTSWVPWKKSRVAQDPGKKAAARDWSICPEEGAPAEIPPKIASTMQKGITHRFMPKTRSITPSSSPPTSSIILRLPRGIGEGGEKDRQGEQQEGEKSWSAGRAPPGVRKTPTRITAKAGKSRTGIFPRSRTGPSGVCRTVQNRG